MMAKVFWAVTRYELVIDEVLKAYTKGHNISQHNKGKRELIRLAEEKGYTVHVENK